MEILDYTKPLETNDPIYTGLTILSTDATRTLVRLESGRGATQEFQFNTATGIYEGDQRMDSCLRLRNTSDVQMAKKFKIFAGKADWEKAQWGAIDTDRHTYADPKVAKKACVKLSEASKEFNSGWKFMLKTVIENAASTNWRGWMQWRFHTGEYVKPVWKDEEWANDFPDHFAHPSAQDPYRIAYIADQTQGLRDKFVVTTPGRYLTQFYSHKLTAVEISRWATKFDSEAELVFYSTPEEIAEGYKSGISSCMSYQDSHFRSKVHPTTIYGAGDFQLAILKRANRSVGRALVLPAKKRWVRLYGDTNRMADQLSALGYRQGTPMDFVGARLLRMDQVFSDAPGVVMPYLDLGLHSDFDPNDEALLRVALRGKITGMAHAYGVVNISSEAVRIPCGHCGDYITENQPIVFVGGSIGRSWHENCATRNDTILKCDFTNTWFRDSDNFPIHPVFKANGEASGKHICKTYLDDFSEQLIEIEDKIYEKEGLDYNVTTETWSLPNKDENRRAA